MGLGLDVCRVFVWSGIGVCGCDASLRVCVGMYGCRRKGVWDVLIMMHFFGIVKVRCYVP